MAGLRVLVPFNFTPYDQKVLDFVTTMFLSNPDAQITLFNLYTPVPEVAVASDSVMTKMKENLSYLAQRITDQESALKTAQIELQKRGFPEQQVAIIHEPKKKDVAFHIIDTAQKGPFDVVVLNHKPARIARFFAGSVFTKVVTSLKESVIMVVT